MRSQDFVREHGKALLKKTKAGVAQGESVCFPFFIWALNALIRSSFQV